MVDFDLPTIEIDLQKLPHRPGDDRGQQESRPAIIPAAALEFAITSGPDHQQTEQALACTPLPEDPTDFFVFHLAAFSAVKDFGGLPRLGLVEPHLLGSKLLYPVETARPIVGAETEFDVLARAGDQLHPLHHGREDGAVAEAAIHRQQQNPFGGATGVEGGAQTVHEVYETGREIVELLSSPIPLPFLLQRRERLGSLSPAGFSLASFAFGKFAARPLDHRDLLESDGPGAGANLGPAKQQI